jgi:curved DNA-binding protein
MTYYEILGIAKEASADEIKRAYRKLASQHHPDKGGDKNKFQEIEQAYRTLSDDVSRQQYDMQLNGFGGQGFRSPGVQEFHFHTGDINDIFRSFGFGNGDPFGQFRQQHQRRNKDLRIEIGITLASTLEEQTKNIIVKTTTGEQSPLEIKIPRGITHGTNIKYSGLGDNLFNTLPRGDLYIQFNIHHADNFIVNGVDLYTGSVVNCLLAITGGKITVTGIDGKLFELTVPPGCQHGTKFRIPKQGLYELNSNHRGDLYVEIGISIPQNLMPEQLESIQAILNTQ